MKLLYISSYQFKVVDNKVFALPAYADFYWEKYLDVFESITVLGEQVKKYLDNGTLAELKNKKINVELLPPNTLPKDYVNDKKVISSLKSYIDKFDAILIKITNRKGLQAIKICDNQNKPYIIELTGDLKLTLSQSPNILKRLYNPFFHAQILKAIKTCKFGLYVTKDYLQKVYPVNGLMCGCTDTIIPDPDEDCLKSRIERIKKYNPSTIYKIGMVASYHDNRKGLDTAIRALGRVEGNVELHVLGLGTKEDREKWFDYAKKYSVESRLYFDDSLDSIDKVLKWNDSIDLAILPSRSEGLPRCIVESISRAVPCILSNVCGMPELVDPEWIHDPNDYIGLSNLINKMLSDKDVLIKCAQKNFKHSFEYKFSVLREKRNNFLVEYKSECERRKK